MSYSEHREFYPVADELLVYLEEHIQEKGANHYASTITAEQVVTLVDFAARFNLMAEDLWRLAEAGLDKPSLVQDLSPAQAVQLLNTF